MLGGSERELFVCFNKREHGVVVRGGIVAGNVALYATLGNGAAFGKLLDQLIA